jgi:hypothetical protein
MGTAIARDDDCLSLTLFIGSLSTLLAGSYYLLCLAGAWWIAFITSTDVMGPVRIRRGLFRRQVSFARAPTDVELVVGGDGSERVLMNTIDEVPSSDEDEFIPAPPLKSVPVTPRGRVASYSPKLIWRNVYGLGGALYMLSVVVQFSNDVAVLSATVGFMLVAFEEERVEHRNRYTVMACSILLSIHLGCMGAMFCSQRTVGMRVYTVPDLGVSMLLPLLVPVLLKSVRKPSNVADTLRMALPCTCMIAILVMCVMLLNLHPCILLELNSWVTADPAVRGVNVDVVLALLGFPLVGVASSIAMLGAILQKRSIDVAVAMSVVHSVQFGVMHANGWWGSTVSIACSGVATALLGISYVIRVDR